MGEVGVGALYYEGQTQPLTHVMCHCTGKEGQDPEFWGQVSRPQIPSVKGSQAKRCLGAQLTYLPLQVRRNVPDLNFSAPVKTRSV